jgi:hypothetical protein
MLLPMLILLNPDLPLPGRKAVSGAADGELETQREVVTSMLLPMLILLNPVLPLPGRNAVSGAADGELETQREVVTSMLLRCLDHPEVIHTLSLIMQWTRNAAGTTGGTKILMNFF